MKKKYKCKCGLGFWHDGNFNPLKKTLKQWQKMGDKIAKKDSKRDGITWRCFIGICDLGQSPDWCRMSFGAKC